MTGEALPRNLEMEIEQMAETILEDTRREEQAAVLVQSVSVAKDIMRNSMYDSWAQATRFLLGLGVNRASEFDKKGFFADLGSICSGKNCHTYAYVKPSGKIKINGYHADSLSQGVLEHGYECPSSRNSYNVLINPAKNSIRITYCGARRSPWKAARHIIGCLLIAPLTFGIGTFIMHGILTEHMPAYATYNSDIFFKKLQKQLNNEGSRKAVKAEHFLEEYLALPNKLYGAFQTWRQQREREKESRLEHLDADRLQLEAKSRHFAEINDKICSIEEKLR